MFQAGVKRMSRGCQELVKSVSVQCHCRMGVKEVTRRCQHCQEGFNTVKRVSRGCQHHFVKNMSRGCPEGVKNMSGGCQKVVEKMSRGCQLEEGVKTTLSRS